MQSSAAHTDGGKLVRELYRHGDHGAHAEIDWYLGATGSNVVALRPSVDSVDEQRTA